MIVVIAGRLNLMAGSIRDQIRSDNHARQDPYICDMMSIISDRYYLKSKIVACPRFYSSSQRRDLNLKSFNIWILCCDRSPFANTRALNVLHLSIMQPVLVGLSVAIALQKRQ